MIDGHDIDTLAQSLCGLGTAIKGIRPAYPRRNPYEKTYDQGYQERDATGLRVFCLTDAVMGVTAGLVQIADSISELAEAVRTKDQKEDHHEEDTHPPGAAH